MKIQGDRIIIEDNDEPIYSARVGTNADLVRDLSVLHLREGMAVADVTFGKGVFWRHVDLSKYNFFASDLERNPRLSDPPANYRAGVDFTCLPYKDHSMDAVFIDPPYMHGGNSTKAEGVNGCYRNRQREKKLSVLALYRSGIQEAHRVLKKGGLVFVKCQDDCKGKEQVWMCYEIALMFRDIGFGHKDKFVLVQITRPMMRHGYQKTARKNHSELLVGISKR